jgi:hypothetical protein
MRVPIDEWLKFDRLIVAWRKQRMPYALALVATCVIGVGVEP